MTLQALTYHEGYETHLRDWHSCLDKTVQEVLQQCQGDDYACLRSYRDVDDAHTRELLDEAVDQRAFASEFLKYRADPDNYALYLWGYVDLMLDYYKTRNPSLLSSEEDLIRGSLTGS